MPDTISLADGRQVDYDEAVDSEADILCANRQWNGKRAFLTDLWQRRAALERLVATHVGVADAACVKTSHSRLWHTGSFNVVVPMLVFASRADAAQDPRADQLYHERILRRVVLRCPLPICCAETHHPGSILEKMRCETASYVWMQRYCPRVRIPHVYGFGFPNGKLFADASHLSFVRRALLRIRQALAALLRRPVPSTYLPIQIPDVPITTGYMVLEHFGDPDFGRELPLVARGQDLATEPAKMRNLFRGLSRIILALARIPQPRIGAFRFYDDGTIALDNRPITCDMLDNENQGAPRTVAVDTTYTNTDQYVADLARFHDQRFRAGRNAVCGEADGQCQMAVRALLSAVTPHFIHKDRRHGPFALLMSDLNASNFMVDNDWNVTGMFDLEWIISGPIDLPRTPTWLTWDSLDHMADKGYEEFSRKRDAFMEVFKAEERLADTGALEAACGGRTLSSIMDESWVSKQAWFYEALLCCCSLDIITKRQLVPLFYGKDGIPWRTLFRLWCTNPAEVVAAKLADRAAYVDELARLFGRTVEAR
ncbi:hypothetical protein SPI_05731 [Niveomyces insectorum RCEF 264]|uniref:Aminoglycoside phosphotransferase n=1 Tax=Niveomyces insectorum RCEF 264 TaxID=1081102 RepID=A0A167SDZ3_9HYPO|nr:hypothetical protein SPI_05731 [Niveomyces insectorum RCEF 264]